MEHRGTVVSALTIVLILAVAAPATAGYYEEEYTTSGTVEDPTATSQAGVVKCGGIGGSVGGACIPFPMEGRLNPDWEGVYITVRDYGPSSHRIPFQVCMDNDGDERCVADPAAECGDRIWANHNDDGTFHGSIGPLPAEYPSGCPGRNATGYIVIVCQGVHAPGDPVSSGHAHPASQGRVKAYINDAGKPIPQGDFCTGSAPGTIETGAPSVPFGVPPGALAVLAVGVAVAWKRRRG